MVETVDHLLRRQKESKKAVVTSFVRVLCTQEPLPQNARVNFHIDDISVSLSVGCQDVFKTSKYIFLSVRPPYSTNSLAQGLIAMSIQFPADGRVSSAFHFLAVTSILF